YAYRLIGWVIILIISCIILSFTIVAYFNKRAENRPKYEKMMAVEMKVDEKRVELARKNEERRRLKFDRKHIEAEARKKIYMVMPGEIPIIAQQDKRMEVPKPNKVEIEAPEKGGLLFGLKVWYGETKEILGRIIFGSGD
ncbi:MAG: hypothetical protein J7M18_01345, partial [Candidatus Eremiobacteraeota bacterium]|nr:hypothetical protein [Candidatus Eremiobacteraeota bacterium]